MLRAISDAGNGAVASYSFKSDGRPVEACKAFAVVALNVLIQPGNEVAILLPRDCE